MAESTFGPLRHPRKIGSTITSLWIFVRAVAAEMFKVPATVEQVVFAPSLLSSIKEERLSELVWKEGSPWIFSSSSWYFPFSIESN